MIYQELRYTCGPASIVNLMKAYGRNYSERYIADLAKTNSYSRGTTNKRLIKTIKKLGIHAFQRKYADHRTAFKALDKAILEFGQPCILTVDNGYHWVACLSAHKGGFTSRGRNQYLIVDSGWGYHNKLENGVRFYSRPKLKRRWYSDHEGYHVVFTCPKEKANELEKLIGEFDE